MPVKNNITLYDKLLIITKSSIGPSAEKLIDHQIGNHVHKPPEKLSRSDLLRLIDWILAAVSLMTEDSEVVEEYASRIMQLVQDEPKPKRA